MPSNGQYLRTFTSKYRPAVLGPPSAIWGLSATAGFTLAQVEAMRRDPQVNLCLRYLVTPLQTAEFEPVKATSPDVAKFVTRQFRRFWQRSLPVVLEAYPYGRSASEVLYRQVKGRLEFDDLKYLSPRDTSMWTVEGEPAWVRVKQTGSSLANPGSGYQMGRGGQVDLWFAEPGKPAKGFWFVIDPLYDPHYGRSVLMSSWLPWRLKTLPTGGGMDALAKWFYRHAYRGYVIRHPNAIYQDAIDQTPIEAQSLARKMIEDLKSGADLALDNSRDDKGEYQWNIESYGEINGEAGGMIEYIQGFLDVQIQRGIGIPDGIITDGGGEGYAGRKIPEDAYYAGAERDFNRVVETFDEQVCRPLVIHEYGPQADYEIKPKPLVPMRQQAAQQAMQQQQGQGGQEGEQTQQPGGEEEAMQQVAQAAGESGARPGGAPALSHNARLSAEGEGQPHILDVPDVAQRDSYDCGAGIAMSICRFHKVGPKDEADYVRALPSTPEAGTPPDRLIHFLKKQGLAVEAKSGWTLDELRAATRQGCPVGCCIQDYGSDEGVAELESGHWVVVIGVELGYVFIQDPSADNVLDDSGSVAAAGKVMIDQKTWESVWRDKSEDGTLFERYGIKVGPPKAAQHLSEDDGVYHGPKAPGAGWVEIEPGPRGGKRWKLKPAAAKKNEGEGAAKQPPDKAAKQHVVGRLLQTAAAMKTTAQDVAKRIGNAVWNKLSPRAQAALTRTYKLAKAVEYKAMLGFHTARKLAVEAARERSLPDTYVDRVGKVLTVVDLTLAWTVNFPATVAVTGSLTAGKVASWVPVASLAYLGMSTAKNPFATLRAAKRVLLSQDGQTSHMGFEGEWVDDTGMDEIGRLLACYQKHQVDPWWEALLYAAIDQTHDMAKAIRAADEAIKRCPKEPHGARMSAPKKDKQGGLVPQDMEAARAVELITLPEGISGKNCDTCRYMDAQRAVCTNPQVNQPVNPRMACKLWDNPGVLRDWKPGQARMSAGPHKFGSTQFNLPDELAKRVRALGEKIPAADLAEDGRETEPHVTIKYGLHDKVDAESIRRLVDGFGPVTITLGKLSLFPANETQSQRGGGEQDVVKIDVLSPDLHRLNRLIAENLPNTDKYPVYKPHITVAYMKPGLGQACVGDGSHPLLGCTFEASTLTFSDAGGGDRQLIPLGKNRWGERRLSGRRRMAQATTNWVPHVTQSGPNKGKRGWKNTKSGEITYTPPGGQKKAAPTKPAAPKPGKKPPPPAPARPKPAEPAKPPAKPAAKEIGPDVAKDRPSKPDERDPDKAKDGPPILPWKAPPAPQGKAAGSGQPVRPVGAESNTHFGDKVEELVARLGLRSILPEGKRSHTAGQVKKLGSTIDREYDHSGWFLEIKACRTTATEYKAKAKKEELKDKEKFAKRHKGKPAICIPVVDPENKKVFVYWRPGLGSWAINPKSKDGGGWNFLGEFDF
jgi:hypothetical protein